jgi:hypothetical protein
MRLSLAGRCDLYQNESFMPALQMHLLSTGAYTASTQGNGRIEKIKLPFIPVI